jgi:hypothetical protein
MYEESRDYVFEAYAADGIVKDRFWFFGPLSCGRELAAKRARLYDATVITVAAS